MRGGLVRSDISRFVTGENNTTLSIHRCYTGFKSEVTKTNHSTFEGVVCYFMRI